MYPAFCSRSSATVTPPCAQTRPCGQTARRRRPIELQYVDHLHIRQAETDLSAGMLIKRAYPIEEIRRMAIAAGWTDLRIESSPLGFEAWMTK
jgi:hypothetical protein